MYRYSVDNAITYTSEDFVLFKESPFACWMERLTLENRDHGIPPDVGSEAPRDTIDTQNDLADTLRAEGKNVMLIEPHLEESIRRSSTLDAMRKGVDFIVNGQLALGALSGSANLLMRTSGYSQLGNYLYVPCSTQKKTSVHSALRLCFLADLLHSLQGQLPPQMLIIRGGSAVVPLETEDHIYHYRAVKHRFMSEQQAFRKHKMPDPAESANFGRWSECANEVLKQRALRNEEESGDGDFSLKTGHDRGFAPHKMGAGMASEPHIFADSAATITAEQTKSSTLQPGYAMPSAGLDVPIAYTPRRVAGSNSAYDLDALNRAPPIMRSEPSTAPGTLAEQARKLIPESEMVSADAALLDDALENLAFIGSSNQVPTIGQSAIRPRRDQELRPERRALVREPKEQIPQLDTIADEQRPAGAKRSERNLEPGLKREQVFADANASMVAPPPSLRNPAPREMVVDGFDAGYAAPAMTPSNYELPEDIARDQVVASEVSQPEPEVELTQPLDSTGFAGDKPSMVDMDDTVPLADTRMLEETTAAAAEPTTGYSVPQSESSSSTFSAGPPSPKNARLREDAIAFTEIFSDKDTYLSDDSSVDTFNSSLITSEDDFET
ncbi:MAG: hypothetical protein V7709_02455 [Halioglobus sp.]